MTEFDKAVKHYQNLPLLDRPMTPQESADWCNTVNACLDAAVPVVKLGITTVTWYQAQNWLQAWPR